MERLHKQVGRPDITPFLANARAFQEAVEFIAQEIEKRYSCIRVDYLVAIDAMGFILGGALAHRLRKGICVVRRRGKIPARTRYRRCRRWDGTHMHLEIGTDSLHPGSNVIVVDDWLFAGAQARCAAQLVEELGARVLGVASIFATRSKGVDRLRNHYPLLVYSWNPKWQLP